MNKFLVLVLALLLTATVAFRIRQEDTTGSTSGDTTGDTTSDMSGDMAGTEPVAPTCHDTDTYTMDDTATVARMQHKRRIQQLKRMQNMMRRN
jgi:hypothetical protein